MRCAARVILLVVYLGALSAQWIAPAGYAEQFREHAGEGSSSRFVMGVDDLGRDRFSRLVYGTRVSLFLAPAAAIVAITFAVTFGLVAGLAGPFIARPLMTGVDLLLSLPSLFLLLIARAMLPLNTGPLASLLVTFTLLGVLGWPAGARVIAASGRSLFRSNFLLQARALGCSSAWRLARQACPHLWPLIAAQFFLLVPVFIVAEANLGILGLGVSEPLPSWGAMLAELTNPSAIRLTPWRIAPAVLLLLVVLSFQLAKTTKEDSL